MQIPHLCIFSLEGRCIVRLLPAGTNTLMAMTNEYLQIHVFSAM